MTPIRASQTQHALALAPAARGFTDLEGHWHDLRRRPLLRRLLLELVEQRRGSPGTGITADRLVEAAWPGEHILPDAATNRLYVALARLRKMGLRDVIQSRPEGYAIDPAVDVVWREEG